MEGLELYPSQFLGLLGEKVEKTHGSSPRAGFMVRAQHNFPAQGSFVCYVIKISTLWNEIFYFSPEIFSARNFDI